MAIAGTALYLILAHPRGLRGALSAVSVPLAVALHRAYGADLLAQFDYAGADARAQGRSLFVVVIACMVAAGVLRWLTLRIDRRLVRVPIGTRSRRIAFGTAGVAALLALVGRHGRVRPPGPDRRPAPRVRARATRRQAPPTCARG